MLQTVQTLLALVVLSFSAASFAVPANSINLVAYLNANIQTPPSSSSIPKYDRLKQFGAWVHQDPSDHCHDTREMVLARAEDPRVPLKYKSGGCTVDTGLWHEPYAGTDVKDAAGLQIDHVVPLKAAYYAGAYAWTNPERCNYANFLANDFHLQAVSGHENMSKGDRGPDAYLPPNEKELCAYVSAWMKIKAIWELNATRNEVDAVQNVIAREHCADSFLYMNKSDLAKQRLEANSPIAACQNFGN